MNQDNAYLPYTVSLKTSYHSDEKVRCDMDLRGLGAWVTRQKMQRKHSTYKQSKGGGLVGGLVHTGDWDMRYQKETSET